MFHQVAHGERSHDELTRHLIGCLTQNTLKCFVMGLTVNYLGIVSVISLRIFTVFVGPLVRIISMSVGVFRRQLCHYFIRSKGKGKVTPKQAYLSLRGPGD
jgi:hypothetical protein